MRTTARGVTWSQMRVSNPDGERYGFVGLQMGGGVSPRGRAAMYRAVMFLFVVILPFVLPVWPYSQTWGFQPALSLTLVFVALSVLHGLKLL